MLFCFLQMLYCFMQMCQFVALQLWSLIGIDRLIFAFFCLVELPAAYGRLAQDFT